MINNISLEIFSGSIVSLLGVNGAGKSTLIKLMLGLEQATRGKIYLYGLNPCMPSARKNIGVVPQVNCYIDELTGKETLQFIAKHYKQTHSIDELIDLFNLDFIHKKTAVLSEGQKKQLSLATGFIGCPQLIFLDEPTVGLDIQARIKLWGIIRSYRDKGATVILSTHYLEEAEALADRVLVLQDGVIRADGTVNKIKILYSANDNLETAFINLTEDNKQ